MLAVTEGKGVGAVIDNVGIVNEGLRCLVYGGRIVLIGFAGRGGVMESIAMNKVLLKGASIVGYRFGESSRRDPQVHKEIWVGYLDMIASGRIQPLIDPKVYRGIKDVPRALQDLADKKLFGKAIIQTGCEVWDAQAKL